MEVGRSGGMRRRAFIGKGKRMGYGLWVLLGPCEKWKGYGVAIFQLNMSKYLLVQGPTFDLRSRMIGTRISQRRARVNYVINTACS